MIIANDMLIMAVRIKFRKSIILSNIDIEKHFFISILVLFLKSIIFTKSPALLGVIAPNANPMRYVCKALVSL